MIVQKLRRYFLGILAFAGAVFLLVFNTPAQNLFVADYSGYKGIYEITPAGSQSNFVSGLSDPTALAFDRRGNLFVSDTGSGSIVEITPGGETNTFASGLAAPYGLAFDNSGNLFEADFASSRILEFTNHNGTLSPSPGVFASGLDGPVGLAFNRAGNLFESDYISGAIYEFTNFNGILASNLNVFATGLTNPAGLAFNNSNVLFVANDVFAGTITRVTSGGSLGTFASGLSDPLGIAFDHAGNLFVANQNANNIVKIAPDGTQSIYYSESSADIPDGIAFMPKARLYALATNKTIQVMVSSPSPYYSTIVEVSSDFTNWVAIATNTPPFMVTNSINALPRQYFRARLCP